MERSSPQSPRGGPPAPPLATRGTTNRNDRGSAEDRRRRRAYLLATYGDGNQAPCYRCAAPLTDATLTVDRIVPGIEGGRYTRDNIRPACSPCNSETGGQLAQARRRAKETLCSP